MAEILLMLIFLLMLLGDLSDRGTKATMAQCFLDTGECRRLVTASM